MSFCIFSASASVASAVIKARFSSKPFCKSAICSAVFGKFSSSFCISGSRKSSESPCSIGISFTRSPDAAGISRKNCCTSGSESRRTISPREALPVCAPEIFCSAFTFSSVIYFDSTAISFSLLRYTCMASVTMPVSSEIFSGSCISWPRTFFGSSVCMACSKSFNWFSVVFSSSTDFGISMFPSTETGNTAKYKLPKEKSETVAVTVKVSAKVMLSPSPRSNLSMPRLSFIPGNPANSTNSLAPSPTVIPFSTSMPLNCDSGKIIPPTAATGLYSVTSSPPMFFVSQ